MLERNQDLSHVQERPLDEPQRITRYAIPLEAFQNPPPIELAEYHAPGRWTRENFTDALVDNFAKSQGNAATQVAQLEWQRLNQGFLYPQTMRNYLQAGGYHCLSPVEQSHIVTSFQCKCQC